MPTKVERIEVKCNFCGSVKLIRPKEHGAYKHHFCNQKCKGQWQAIHRIGKNSANWQGGDTKVKCVMCDVIYLVTKYHLRLNIKRQSNHFCSYRCRDEYRSRYLVGSNSGNWKGGGKKILCDYCQNEIVIKKYQIDKHQHHFCSAKCQYSFYQGDRHYCWNGGTTFEPYTPEFNAELKLFIKERDKYQCAICKKDLVGKRIDIHHIDYDKKHSNRNNLIALCVNCHLKTNFNRDYWREYLTNIINRKINWRQKPIQASGGK
jgi:hypothetical protein